MQGVGCRVQGVGCRVKGVRKSDAALPAAVRLLLRQDFGIPGVGLGVGGLRA